MIHAFVDAYLSGATGLMVNGMGPASGAMAGTGVMTGSMTGGGSPPPLQAVGRIRNVFPETWLWSNATTGYMTWLKSNA